MINLQRETGNVYYMYRQRLFITVMEISDLHNDLKVSFNKYLCC